MYEDQRIAPLYLPGPTDCENPELYGPDGMHPVDVGDAFQDKRYKVMHKLGSGGFSTVWLARDTKQHNYVALKILSASGSRRLREVGIQHFLDARLSKYEEMQVAKILDHFVIHGVNGKHTVLVMAVHGPSLYSLSNARWKIRPDTARTFARQIGKVIGKLHSVDLAFGDLSSSNILLELEDISTLPESRIYEQFGKPCRHKLRSWGRKAIPIPHAPKYQYSPIQIANTATDLIKPSIILTDLNEAVYIGTSESMPYDDPAHSAVNTLFQAPEYFFGLNTRHTKASDVWALACIFYEIRTSQALVSCNVMGECDMIENYQLLFGEQPPQVLRQTMDARDDTTNCTRGILSNDILLEKAQSIAQKLEKVGDWLPWVTMTPDQRRAYVSRDCDTDEVHHPALRLFRDELQCLEDQPPPLAALSAEELADLTDLLQKMLTWLPEDRITIEDVFAHPWMNNEYKDLDEQGPWLQKYFPGLECAGPIAALARNKTVGDDDDDGLPGFNPVFLDGSIRDDADEDFFNPVFLDDDAEMPGMEGESPPNADFNDSKHGDVHLDLDEAKDTAMQYTTEPGEAETSNKSLGNSAAEESAYLLTPSRITWVLGEIGLAIIAATYARKICQR